MANVDVAFGLRPVGHLLGLDWSDKINWYYHPATDATPLYLNSPVIHGGTADTTGKFPVCAAALVASAYLLGTAVAFRTDAPDTQNPSTVAGNDIPRQEYCPASTAMYIGVVDDPYVIFEIQDDAAATLTVADVGNIFSITAAAGSAVTGQSTVELDADDADPGVLRIIRLAPSVKADNTVGDNAVWQVTINKHLYKTIVTSVD